MTTKLFDTLEEAVKKAEGTPDKNDTSERGRFYHVKLGNELEVLYVDDEKQLAGYAERFQFYRGAERLAIIEVRPETSKVTYFREGKENEVQEVKDATSYLVQIISDNFPKEPAYRNVG